MVKNAEKLVKIAENLVKIGKNIGQNWQKHWSKLLKNWSKLLKKWSKLLKNWSKLLKNGQNWQINLSTETSSLPSVIVLGPGHWMMFFPKCFAILVLLFFRMNNLDEDRSEGCTAQF
jgi:predicted PurR-regulated permease PerM